MGNRYLRVKQVAEKTGIAVSTVWRLAKDAADFPKPFKLTQKVTVWDEAQVDAWIESRRLNADAAAA